MEEKLFINENEFITYKFIINNSTADFDILYLHGFCGDMDGTKGTLIETIAKNKKINLIKLNYLGHGTSSGKMIDYTMGDWFNNIKEIINLYSTKKLLVVGSSMGGWFSYLVALEYKDKIKGIMTFATAVDFLTEFIEPKSDLSKHIVYEIVNSDGSGSGNFITDKLLFDSKLYNLFEKSKLEINCPVRLIHGMKDTLIPYTNSIRLAEKLTTDNLKLLLVKNMDHRMSLNGNLDILSNELNSLIDLLKN